LPNLNTSILAALPFALPPIEEQEAIASILGSLDDKIEQNRHENETLKAMARALFRSWFVDFDPVRAKMEGRQPVGMDADTAALFPDGFEESALGPIPRGWQVKELGACSDYLSRGVAPSYVGESPVRTLNQKAIQWWNLDQSAFKFHDPNKAVRSDAFIRKDDLVINSTGDGTIGRIYWFYHDLEDLFADSHVAIVRLAKDVLLPEMVVF
jgi:type I restriction enzyme S subunit